MPATPSGLPDPKTSIEDAVFGVALAIAAYVASYRAYVFNSLHPQLFGGEGQELAEVSYWLLSALLVLWVAYRDGMLLICLQEWKKRLYLLPFLVLAVLSVSWSTAPLVTTYRVLALLSATWVASYLGLRCTVGQILRFLSWGIACWVLASYYYVLFDPFRFGLQRFYGPDVWRGIFWNRNHLGSLAALFSIILLLRLCDNALRLSFNRLIVFLLYCATLYLVIRSRSTTGVLVCLIAHVACLSLVLWTRIHHRMQRRHYIIAAGLGLVLVLVFLLNLKEVFGTFNKDFRLSGRTGLWEFLIREVVAERPMLGHGLGALWSEPVFRRSGTYLIGSEPLIGDSGFIDVLMSLGVVGFVLFMVVFVFAWHRAFRELWRCRAADGIFPLMILLCVLLSNLTFSLMLEIDFFYWGLIVVVLFSCPQGTLPLSKRCV